MIRDITLEDTIYMMFSTRQFSSGATFTLANTPVVSAYENEGTTEITAGITLGVDHDGVTGLNLLTIVATAANGFENGKDYNLVITTGTVDSVSVVGEVVGGFTIGRSAAAVDLANGTDGLGAIKTETALIVGDTDELQSTLSAGIAGKTKDANLKDSIQNIIDIIESQRTHHSHIATGSIFYVDSVNGDTHANGNRGGISDPYLTIQDCHDNAVTDSNHDLILLLPGAAAGVTTHTVAATTTISKRYTLIRGPGRDMIVTRTGSGDTFAITGEGVELEGFQLGTAATGSGNGATVTGDFAQIHNLWVNDTQGDGININQADNCLVELNRFQNTGAGGSGDGVEINGTGTSSNNNIVRLNVFEDVTGDAIKLTGGTITDTVINNNIIHGSTGWGINISADSTDAFVTDNALGGNASGDIQDNGTTSVIVNNEQWGTATALAVVDGVVDAILVDTNELQTDWTDGGRLDLILDAIIADTNELQTDWVNGGRLDLIIDAILEDTGTTLPATLATAAALAVVDTIVDAIKAKTDSLTFTTAGEVDANIQSVNDVPVTGTGSLGDEWGP